MELIINLSTNPIFTKSKCIFSQAKHCQSVWKNTKNKVICPPDTFNLLGRYHGRSQRASNAKQNVTGHQKRDP